MTIRSDFPFAVSETENLFIPMADGTKLAARLWRPEGAGKVPLVLEYIPYRKRDGTLPRDEMMHPYVAGHGYACLRVDIRGNGDSEGLMDDEYTPQELEDACAVIAWAAAQDWCSGAVGMMGKSWGGFNCLQTAFLRPPALKAVVSVCSTSDRFEDDIHFRGGCMLGENFGWGAVMLSYSSRPADPLLRPDWRADWLARLQAQDFLAPRWAAHQARDSYWRHGSICEDWSGVQVPVLIVGGWADSYMNTLEQLLVHQQSPVKALMGPWVHQYPHTAVPGPQIGFLAEMVRWWDHWLKGIDNGVATDPALRAYMVHSEPPNPAPAQRKGHWLAEATWPSPRVTDAAFALGAAGVLGGAGQPQVQIATPQDLGLMAGEFFPMGLDAEMPGDQAAEDAACACWEMDCPEGLDLLGRAELRVRLTSDQPFGHLIARLCDVAPDGRSTYITRGMLNLRHRDSRADPQPVPVGQGFEARLRLDFCGYRLAPGHRLRLAVSNSYWPFVWPAPVRATLTVTGGSLSLPLHQGSAGDEWATPAPETARPANLRTVSPGQSHRRVIRDLIAGTVVLDVLADDGTYENQDHGLITGSSLHEIWTIHPDDPLSARCEMDWHQTLGRGDWQVRTRAHATLTCTADSLIFAARLEAWEGEARIFARDFHNLVPRDHC